MRIRLVLPLIVSFAATAAVAAPDKAVHEFTLDNGLKLLVKEDHRAPVVVSQVWYKVGASYEPPGLTGISHVLEHMMFKGTEKHPAGEFSRIISENGGRENAFTGRDYTAYFQQLEKSRLKVSFELEADRMRHLTLPKEEFEKEVKVVMEERRLRTEDDPEALTYERFNAAAYITSPYHHPVIGWMHDLEQLTIEDLRRWYRQWYAPNNAVVVVVGDVDAGEVLALAKKHFGPLKPQPMRELYAAASPWWAKEHFGSLKSQPLTPPDASPELAHKGLRRITVRAPARLPYVVMGYKVPSLATAEQEWEPYALEVLAAVLDGGRSARLSGELVRGSGVATSAGAGYDLGARLSTLFLLEGTPGQGKDAAAVEQALRAQIRRLRAEPVTAAELERVKAQVVADNVYQRDSVFYQAMQLGMLETVGLGWPRSKEYVERVQAVTAEQVQAVAKKYLHADRLTIAVLDPLPMKPGEANRRRSGGHGAMGGGHVR